MSHWNHRIIERIDARGTETGHWLEICEVHYGDDGRPYGHTDAIGVTGENLDELRQTLEWMQRALTQPILKEDVDFADKEKGE